ncbi:lipopolysaccharide biosynthesis protein [Nonomuraea zeae]|uniref:Lipopolysaccharide biosynthesis protein n=1 Tax=Nonomuraea zeae TaxID=1642303 RepID=A0A5S4FYI6_9ACTN|nr:lipopolysaccharide biosynthesis protein [Nonomuraea zeae]TMR25776.1 lipopolysaccharide biosynthesis protein [Nonomuraea zeae]
MTWTRSGARGLLWRWWLPLSLTLGALGGLAYAMVKEAVYAADAYVVVVAAGDPARAADFAAAYARVSVQPGLLLTDAAERRSLTVAASPDAPLVRLTSTAATGQLAADRANRAATALIAYANTHSADTHVRLASFAEASSPALPSAPVPLISVAVGACGAALVGGLARLAAPRARPQASREPAPVLVGAEA